MKKITSLLFFVSLILSMNVSLGQGQVPNGNFENWDSQNKATGWTSSVNFIMEINFASQSSDAYEGSRAAKITSQSVIGNNVPGIMTLGRIVIQGMGVNIVGGVPFTDKPTEFRGWYKYAPSGIDSMIVFCLLTKFNAVSGLTDTIGGAVFTNTTAVSTYTMFDVNFEYWNAGNPDTMNIMILSSGFNASAGSNVIIDALSFSYGTVGINEVDALDYYVYPNPTNGLFNIAFAKNESRTISVYNFMGQVVYSENALGFHHSIDLRSMNKGIYLLEINNGVKKEVKKIVLK